MPTPFRTDALRLSSTHTLHVAHYGTPNTTPVLFVHGGPGGNVDDDCAQYFDRRSFHVVAFDQRGCGKSTPRNELRDNTPMHAVADIERLRRRYFPGKRVVLFGGSYGSALVLLYAATHAKWMRAFVVRGVYLFGPVLHPELRARYPRAWRALQRRTRRKTLAGVASQTARALSLASSGRATRGVARTWCALENKGLVSDARDLVGTAWEHPAASDLHTCALMESHFESHRFWNAGAGLLERASAALRKARVPGVILHGEQDAVCPVANARALHAALDDGSERVRLVVVHKAAHSALDKANARALRAAVRTIAH